ncbi:MAG: hypothetical protein ACFFCW_13005 [Candidatus Hodarchaeota archaeon]
MHRGCETSIGHKTGDIVNETESAIGDSKAESNKWIYYASLRICLKSRVGNLHARFREGWDGVILTSTRLINHVNLLVFDEV